MKNDFYDEDENEEEEQHKDHFKLPTLPASASLPKISLTHVKRLPHTKKLFLSIIVIIVLLLAISIFLTKQQQESKENEALFTAVYDPALKNYEEAKELKGLNPALSQKEFDEAAHILQDGQTKFKQGSPVEKKREHRNGQNKR